MTSAWRVDQQVPGGTVTETYPTHLAAVERVAELDRKGVRFVVVWQEKLREPCEVAISAPSEVEVDPNPTDVVLGRQIGETRESA